MPRLPGSQDVQQVGYARDPGVSVPQPVSSGLEYVAEAVGGIAENMAKAEARIQKRNDAIFRADDYTKVNDVIEERYRGFEASEDLSLPSTLQKFKQELDRDITGVLNSHAGSDDSRATLTEQAFTLRSKIMDRAIGQSLKIGRAKVGHVKQQGIAGVASRIYSNPSGWLDGLKDNDNIVDTYADIDDIETTERDRNVGRATVTQSAIDSFIDRGDFDGAEAIINNPIAIQSLGAEKAMSNLTRITTNKYKSEKDASEFSNKIRSINSALPPNQQLKPTDIRALAGIKDDDVSAKISILEQRGVKVTQEMVEVLAGVRKPIGTGDGDVENLYGNTMEGKAMSRISSNLSSFRNGMLTPEQEQQFLFDANVVMQPQKDPNTGAILPPKAPPLLTQVLQERGFTPGEGAAMLPPGVQEPERRVPGAVTPTGAQPSTGGAGLFKGKQTVSDLAGLVAGPVSAGAAVIGSTPVVGEVARVEGVGEREQARSFVKVTSQQLVNMLQNNPRYAEGERKDIADRFSLDPSLFDTEDAYRNRISGVGEALKMKLQEAQATFNDPYRDKIDRDYARELTQKLPAFLTLLGVDKTGAAKGKAGAASFDDAEKERRYQEWKAGQGK